VIATDGICRRARRCWVRGRVRLQPRGPAPQSAPLQLQPHLTGAADAHAGAAGHPAAADAGQRLPGTAQPGQLVRDLGQFHLHPAGAGPGVPGEDVEDQRGPVDDRHPDPGLQVASLPGRQLAVGDDHVGPAPLDRGGQFLGLARAQEAGRVGPVPALHQLVDHRQAVGLGEPAELVQRRGRAGCGVALPVGLAHRDEDSFRMLLAQITTIVTEQPRTRHACLLVKQPVIRRYGGLPRPSPVIPRDSARRRALERLG
jgi:hypothetical protein